MTNNGKVRLCRKGLADAANDYAWKTDRELASLDATTPLATTFSEYLSGYSSALHNPKPPQNEFAIKTRDGKHIGNCAYYGIKKTRREAEVGIIIGNCNYWDRGYGTDAVKALIIHIFRSTDLIRIHLKTLRDNKRAQRCFSKCGFTTCGHQVKEGHKFVLMELTRSRYQERTGPVASGQRYQADRQK